MKNFLQKLSDYLKEISQKIAELLKGLSDKISEFFKGNQPIEEVQPVKENQPVEALECLRTWLMNCTNDGLSFVSCDLLENFANSECCKTIKT